MLFRPFRAGRILIRIPRALPWAFLFRPLRGGRKAQHQKCGSGSDLAERVALAGVLLPRKLGGDHAALVSELVGLARVEPTPREDLAAQCPDSRRAVRLP